VPPFIEEPAVRGADGRGIVDARLPEFVGELLPVFLGEFLEFGKIGESHGGAVFAMRV
jgi:hypothetical protein